MFGLFMAVFGVFLLLAAGGLWLSRRVLKPACSPGAAVLASKPSASGISPQAAAFLTAAAGMLFVLLSVLEG
jgi:hypothetical protein